MSMPVRAALQPLMERRDDSTLVITHQGSARVWPSMAQHALDFHYNPSTMGGAIPFGLGIALSRPDLHIIVVTGDGSLAMNLGSLVTVVAAQASNLTVVVLDNGIYEVTGGQTVATRVARVDYGLLGKSLGFPTASSFEDCQLWSEAAAGVLASTGPRLISLVVEPALPSDMHVELEAISYRLAELAKALKTECA